VRQSPVAPRRGRRLGGHGSGARGPSGSTGGAGFSRRLASGGQAPLARAEGKRRSFPRRAEATANPRHANYNDQLPANVPIRTVSLAHAHAAHLGQTLDGFSPSLVPDCPVDIKPAVPPASWRRGG